jgi:hypothetical protein
MVGDAQKSGSGYSAERRASARDGAIAEARERAAVRLRLGDIESYCARAIECGDWDAAIAAAPAVSLTYWASLLSRRADLISSEGGDAEEASRMLLVAGKPGEAAAALAAAGREDDAFVVACTADAGGFPAPPPTAASASVFARVSGGTSRFRVSATRLNGAREMNESAPSGFDASHDFRKTANGNPLASPGGKLSPLSPRGSASGSALASLAPVSAAAPARAAEPVKASFYDYTVQRNGEPFALDAFRGNVTVVLNVASE